MDHVQELGQLTNAEEASTSFEADAKSASQIEAEWRRIVEFINPSDTDAAVREIQNDFSLKQSALFAYLATLMNQDSTIVDELTRLKKTTGFKNVTRDNFSDCPQSLQYFEKLNQILVEFDKERESQIRASKDRKLSYEFTLDQYKLIKRLLDSFVLFTFEDKARVVRLMCKHDELSEALDKFFQAHVLFKREKDLALVKDFAELSSLLYEKIFDEQLSSLHS